MGFPYLKGQLRNPELHAEGRPKIRSAPIGPEEPSFTGPSRAPGAQTFYFLILIMLCKCVLCNRLSISIGNTFITRLVFTHT